MRGRRASVVAAAIGLLSTPAAANESGLAGYSGKPNVSAPQGESCGSCHSGGAAPQVSITGPNSLTAGQSAEYVLVVQTNQTRAAGGVAATDGVTLAPVSGLRDSFGELVQNNAVAPSGGQATFRFKVTAPMTGTTFRLWAVGLGANANGANSGDGAGQTTKDIGVTGGSTPTTPPPKDAGASDGSPGTPASSSSGGATAPGKTTSGASPGGGSATGEDDDRVAASSSDEEDDPATSRRHSTDANGAACSLHARTGACPTLFWGIAIVSMALAARRRKGER